MFKDKDTPTTDEGICSGVELPAPWTTGKVVESPHPLKVIETERSQLSTLVKEFPNV